MKTTTALYRAGAAIGLVETVEHVSRTEAYLYLGTVMVSGDEAEIVDGVSPCAEVYYFDGPRLIARDVGDGSITEIK